MVRTVDRNADNTRSRLLTFQIWFVRSTTTLGYGSCQLGYGSCHSRPRARPRVLLFNMERDERLRRRREQYRERRNRETPEERQQRLARRREYDRRRYAALTVDQRRNLQIDTIIIFFV